MQEKIYITWEKFTKDLENFLKNLKKYLEENNINPKEKSFKMLIPCRWWEIIWSLIKNNLGLSENQIIRIKFSNTNYENEKKWIIIKSDIEKNIFENLKNDNNIKNILFIDDLLDSWETIRFIRKNFTGKNLIIWTIYKKIWKTDKNLLDLESFDLPDVWIDFPWEDFYEK